MFHCDVVDHKAGSSTHDQIPTDHQSRHPVWMSDDNMRLLTKEESDMAILRTTDHKILRGSHTGNASQDFTTKYFDTIVTDIFKCSVIMQFRCCNVIQVALSVAKHQQLSMLS